MRARCWRILALCVWCTFASFASRTEASPRVAAWLIGSAASTGLSTPQDYISRFVLYVRWPDEAAIKAWQVCVASPANANEMHYAALTVRDRVFVVRHVSTDDTLDGCQILDLSDTNPAQVAHFLQLAQTLHGVLTVGSGRNFCSAGGQICLHLQEPSGGFEVNLSAVKSSGLAINAQLLMLARQAAAEGASP